MLKALFLDMDETLCDTTSANIQAIQLLADAATEKFNENFDGMLFSQSYVSGIYRNWSEYQRNRYMPIIENQSEEAFRIQLMHDLLIDHGIENTSEATINFLHHKFDADRLNAFNFYPGIKEFLIEAKKLFTLVVITNGPEFSQTPKVETVNLADLVNHIIIGGLEPEEKPARSIFEKALKLAKCQANEAIHIGDSLKADITGAYNSGIASVWVQHQQAISKDFNIKPNYTISHPRELPSLIYKIHHG